MLFILSKVWVHKSSSLSKVVQTLPNLSKTLVRGEGLAVESGSS
jgi:hypothetical protein